MRGGDALEEDGDGLAAMGVHAHVEGAGMFEDEAARGIVELHGGDAEVGENQVGTGKILGDEDFLETGEIGLVSNEGVGLESRLGLGEFNGIDVEADEASAGLDAGEEFPGVAAVAEGAVDRDFAGLGIQHFENLGNHDGAVGAGGSLTGGEDFGDGVGVEAGGEFFVLVLEAAGIFPGITRAPVMGRGAGQGLGKVKVPGLVCVHVRVSLPASLPMATATST